MRKALLIVGLSLVSTLLILAGLFVINAKNTHDWELTRAREADARCAGRGVNCYLGMEQATTISEPPGNMDTGWGTWQMIPAFFRDLQTYKVGTLLFFFAPSLLVWTLVVEITARLRAKPPAPAPPKP